MPAAPPSRRRRSPGRDGVHLPGVATALRAGRHAAGGRGAADSHRRPDRWGLRTVRGRGRWRSGAGVTRVEWAGPWARRRPRRAGARGAPASTRCGSAAALFGANAPDWRVIPDKVQDTARTQATSTCTGSAGTRRLAAERRERLGARLGGKISSAGRRSTARTTGPASPSVPPGARPTPSTWTATTPRSGPGSWLVLQRATTVELYRCSRRRRSPLGLRPLGQGDHGGPGPAPTSPRPSPAASAPRWCSPRASGWSWPRRRWPHPVKGDAHRPGRPSSRRCRPAAWSSERPARRVGVGRRRRTGSPWCTASGAVVALTRGEVLVATAPAHGPAETARSRWPCVGSLDGAEGTVDAHAGQLWWSSAPRPTTRSWSSWPPSPSLPPARGRRSARPRGRPRRRLRPRLGAGRRQRGGRVARRDQHRGARQRRRHRGLPAVPARPGAAHLPRPARAGRQHPGGPGRPGALGRGAVAGAWPDLATGCTS